MRGLTVLSARLRHGIDKLVAKVIECFVEQEKAELTEIAGL